ncbi:TIGR02996 domain-containing protein [Limnoglobus roseus]
MIEEDTFLASVCSQPRDNQPRLAFADWLDESGDSR